MFSRFAPIFAQSSRLIQRCFLARHRSFLLGLAMGTVSSVLPATGLAQVTPAPVPGATVTVFLADPQLGVVGAYQGGGNTLYFEARTPDGSTAMSVRLLDADGRTIAISGTSMDSEWSTADYDAISAAQSLSLASALSSGLATALPGGGVFSSEATALSNLATVVSQVAPGTAAVRADSVAASVPAPSPAVAATIASQYDAAAAKSLGYARDALGNLNVSFAGAALQAFVLSFPDQQDEDTGAMGVVETSARLVTTDGTTIAHLLGGDSIPDAWYPNMFQDTPSTTVDPIQLYSQVGNAIRGAALLARFPSIATPEEADVFNTLALNLRSNALVPIPLAASSAAGNLYSRVAIWWKPTLVIAQHSGTIVRHLQGQPGHLHQRNETIYCNHGTCPGKATMHFKCMFTTAGLSAWRNVPHGIVPAGQQGAGQLHSCYKTKYDVLSGSDCISPYPPYVVCNPGHNCHDDSWTQVRAIKGESFLLSGGPRCNDFTLYKTAPKCTD